MEAIIIRSTETITVKRNESITNQLSRQQLTKKFLKSRNHTLHFCLLLVTSFKIKSIRMDLQLSSQEIFTFSSEQIQGGIIVKRAYMVIQH